ncbi:MAG: tetratricopeptide repeat protein, partial [Candidatus Latescibacteria bacterium]|nr:tetratricopeptide repeat protein [Candidatus Latescibacterota bacterium]
KLYLQQEEPQKAKDQLVLALETEPQNAEAYFLLGKIYSGEGDFAAMDSSFARAADLTPKFEEEIDQIRDYYWAREYNGGVQAAQGDEIDFDRALTRFKNATLIRAGRLEAWRNLAYVYYQLDQDDRAIASYQRIVAADSVDANSLYSLGVLYISQDRYQEAEQVLTQLSRTAPDHYDGHINLAVAQVRLEDLEGAEENYLKAIAIDATRHSAHYNLGNLYWQQQSYTAARKAYEQTLALAPDDDALYNLAITHLALEDMEAAIPLLLQLSQRMPDNASVWRELGRIYAHKGMLEESKAAYAKEEALGQ